MKFSYSLIKQLVPALKSPEQLVDILTMHVFEVESVVGDMIDIKVLPNRFSDTASHWGIAREVAAILNEPLVLPKATPNKWKPTQAKFGILVKIEEKDLCSRYMARYVEVASIGESPEWLQKILKECGMRSINVVVDIMNYAMLETGQPMHAFDADKLKSISVRKANHGEKIETLDGQNFELSSEDLVIADGEQVLAIAGIKGGKRAEVTKESRRLILESANFEGGSIYKTSKKLKLSTDASIRFSHNLSPNLTALAMERAVQLLVEICGAKVGEVVDVYPKKLKPVVIKFSLLEFQKISGLAISAKEALAYLKKIDFKIKGLMVTAPLYRTDIERMEDLVDEIVRLYGYDKLPATSPQVALRPTEHDDSVKFKKMVRDVLVSLGYSEAYNYSFVSEKDLEKYDVPKSEAVLLKNPISSEFAYLRPMLVPNLAKNIEANFRFFETIRLFEIGNVFTQKDRGILEATDLSIVLGSKKTNLVIELKGILSALFGALGLVEYSFDDLGLNFSAKGVRLPDGQGHSFGEKTHEVLKIMSGQQSLGHLGVLSPNILKHVAVAELDFKKLLQLVSEEREYEPIAKFPSVMRDISMLVKKETRVGDILELIQSMSPKLVYDVDLLDYYEDATKMAIDKKSLTFRIVFQAADRTLTDEEVAVEMSIIVDALKEKLGVEIR